MKRRGTSKHHNGERYGHLLCPHGPGVRARRRLACPAVCSHRLCPAILARGRRPEAAVLSSRWWSCR